MKLICVVGNLGLSGPNLQLCYLLAAISSRLSSVAIVATSRKGDRRILSHLHSLGCAVHLPEGTGLRSLFRTVGLVRTLCAGDAIFQSYGLRPDLVCFLARVRPWITQVRNRLHFNYLQRFGAVGGNILFAINRFLILRSDRVVSCSDSVRNDLRSLGVPSVEIRNAIDPELFRKFLCADGVVRAGLPAPTYVTVSSSIPGKNVELVLSAFVPEGAVERSLVVLGPVSESTRMRFGGYANIKFLGPSENPGSVIAGCDYFVSASTHEGQPNAPLEALVLGKPVALSKIPPHLSILDAFGFPVGVSFHFTVDSLRSALAKLEAGSFREILRDNATGICSIFSSERMGESFLALYTSLSPSSR